MTESGLMTELMVLLLAASMGTLAMLTNAADRNEKDNN